ncbi:MAG TPA: type VI secretion system tube protein Hcp [Acidobacteriota bacterium]|nr:type VI secretion system tube protein Hcp [Acidobacteriota bacterium]
MAFDAFLKMEGIQGESRDEKHKEWTEMLHFNVSHNQRAAVSSSSHGSKSAERADFSEFSFTKALDKSTPHLAFACASGQHFSKATIEICRAGGTSKQTFMRYTLQDVMVTNYSVNGVGGGGDGESIPTENIQLSYGKIEWVYIPTDQTTGQAKGSISKGWDLTQNKAA